MANPKGQTYRFQSDYAEITFNVVGFDTWTDEAFDSAAEFDLTCYVSKPEDYWLDDAWDYEPNEQEIATLLEDVNG